MGAYRPVDVLQGHPVLALGHLGSAADPLYGIRDGLAALICPVEQTDEMGHGASSSFRGGYGPTHTNDRV